MPTVTRNQTRDKLARQLARNGAPSPEVKDEERPIKRERSIFPPIPSPITPAPEFNEEDWVVNYPHDWNRFFNAPHPFDNSDIPSLDLGEAEDELSLWERADNAWNEHCQKKAKDRKARLKKQGGITKAQRKWARKQKGKKEAEIIEWFQEKLQEREDEP